MSIPLPTADGRSPSRGSAFLRSQMRNIAPFATLICLVGFFAIASPSFATLDNLSNILTQISVTGIMAVGLTFVILCGEIDLSVAAVANAVGIVVGLFHRPAGLREHSEPADGRRRGGGAGHRGLGRSSGSSMRSG